MDAMKPCLILVTGDPTPSAQRQRGSFADMIRAAAGESGRVRWEELDLRVLRDVPSPLEHSAVIVTGSPSMVTDEEPWMTLGMAYLCELVAAGVPVLGICFGHQLLAKAMGGHVALNPKGREIGSVAVEVTAENPLIVGKPPLSVNMTHLQAVVGLPAGARVIARTSRDPHAAVQFGGAAWGVQFHPEMDAEILRCYIRERREALWQEGLDPVALERGLQDALAGRAVICRFLLHHGLG